MGTVTKEVTTMAVSHNDRVEVKTYTLKMSEDEYLALKWTYERLQEVTADDPISEDKAEFTNARLVAHFFKF